MRRSVLGSVLCGVLGACTVGNTGNPHVGESGSHPEGITLLRSELARDTTPAVSDTERAQFGADQRKFSFALYDKLKRDGRNLFFSPYSISTALAMVYAGAKGETKQEMTTALSFSLPEPNLHAAFNATDLTLEKRAEELEKGQSGDGFRLSTTNANFVQKGLEVQPDFLDVLATNYAAGLFLADFHGNAERERMAINDWVKEQTEQRIGELLPATSLDERTKLVLVNTIFFKGSWQLKFDPKRTEDAPFHATDGDKTVPMMSGTFKEYFDGDGYQAVQLPYASDNVRMLLILPDDAKLSEIEARLQAGLFDEARTGLSQVGVAVKLPRFSFSADLDLIPPLEALGMKRAFDAADFSGIAGAPGDLFISGVFHQGFIAVDEAGTEAAAATAVVVGSRGAAIVSASVTFDRPFLFMIYDDPTGEILFAGKLSTP